MAAPGRRKDHDDTECEARSCFDTNEWINMHKKKQGGSEPGGVRAVGSDETTRRPDCPLDIRQLGRSTWGFLHTMAANYPQKPSQKEQEDMKKFIELFGKFYPCEFCAKDFRNSIKKYEPQVQNRESFSQWMCQQHNFVNVKLGKPEFDCRLVNQRWRDGWKDGSCD